MLILYTLYRNITYIRDKCKGNKKHIFLIYMLSVIKELDITISYTGTRHINVTKGSV